MQCVGSLAGGLACLCCSTHLVAQLPADPVPVSETVVERGAHHAVVETTHWEADPEGRPVPVTGRYVQIEDGLNYWEEEFQEWRPAQAVIEVINGVGVARYGQQRVIFAPNVNDAEGAITLSTVEGVTLRCSVLALAYYDAASGRDVVLAVVKDTAGEVLAPNRILYRDAFDGLAADVLYTYRRSGLEQDIILRACPPDPEAYGLLAEATRLQVLTEFFEAPTPTVRVQVLDRVEDEALRAAMVEPDWVDEELDFGPFWMGQGRALSLEEWGEGRTSAEAVPVGKQWRQQDGRTLLFESADYWSLAPALSQLPSSDGEPRRIREARRGGGTRGRVERLAGVPAGQRWTATVERAVPRRLRATAAVPGLRPARARETTALSADHRPGVVLDFETVNGTKTDYVFRADTTHYVSGAATMSGSTVTFEGGTVIKYAAGVGATIGVNAATRVVWRGGKYRPVVMTAKDDHGVGQKIGSATSVSGYYATTALGLTYNVSYGPFDLAWCRVSHAQTGISVSGGSGHTLRHLQVINCDQGLVTSSVSAYAVQNGLFQGVNKAFSGSSSVTATHLTVNGGALRNAGQPTVTLQNSLLTGVSDVGSGYGADSQVLGSASGVFQTVQQGAHYLAVGSPYRNWSAALTTIDSGLLQDLRQLTTYPPVALTSDFALSTTLSPQVERDVDTLDLGYHYLLLDYLVSGRSLAAGCTLLLTNGVSLGAHGSSMLTFQSGTARFVSEGTPARLNRLACGGAVQEQPTAGLVVPGQWISDYYNGANRGYNVTLRFTALALPGEASRLTGAGPFTGTITLQDCQVTGMDWYVHNQSGWSYSPNVVFHNNVLERCTLKLSQGYEGLPGYLGLTWRNNLMRSGALTLWYTNATYGAWELNDNLYDGVSFTLTPTNGVGMPAGYNGFIGATGPSGWSNNKNSLSRDFVAGPLGEYYYPPSGGAPSLASLINADTTRTPGSVGLYHYTTVATAGSKETTTVLDIGFHYVGVNAVGQPLDTDGDGLPDYLEDRNGNGSAGTGETDWQTSQNGTTGQPGLQVFSPLE